MVSLTQLVIGLVALGVLGAAAWFVVLPALSPPAAAPTATPALAATPTPVTLATPTPVAAAAYAPPAEEYDPEAIAKNTQLYGQLEVMGIQEPLVDVTRERVLVRFNIPPRANEESAAYLVFGAAASVAPEVPQVVVQTFEDYQPRREYRAAMQDILDTREGRMSFDAFKAKVTVTPLT